MSPLIEIRSATPEEIEAFNKHDQEVAEKEKEDMAKIEKALTEEGIVVLEFFEGTGRYALLREEMEEMQQKIGEHLNKSPLANKNISFSSTEKDFRGNITVRIKK